jgi:small subunit ribosomal protein S5
MRAVFETLGIQDVVAKSIGSSNPYNMIKATFDALRGTMSPKSVAARRGKSVAEVLNRGGRVGKSSAEKVIQAEASAE